MPKGQVKLDLCNFKRFALKDYFVLLRQQPVCAFECLF